MTNTDYQISSSTSWEFTIEMFTQRKAELAEINILIYLINKVSKIIEQVDKATREIAKYWIKKYPA